MPKKLPATRITNRLAQIPKHDLYCYEALVGQNGIVETWHCPFFEGRINRAPISQRWGHCQYYDVTDTAFAKPLSLLWDEVKLLECQNEFSIQENLRPRK